MGYAGDVDEIDLRNKWIQQLQDSWKGEPKPPQADVGSSTIQDADPRRMMVDTLPNQWKLNRDVEAHDEL
jgi:hypothetical protein